MMKENRGINTFIMVICYFVIIIVGVSVRAVCCFLPLVDTVYAQSVAVVCGHGTRSSRRARRPRGTRTRGRPGRVPDAPCEPISWGSQCFSLRSDLPSRVWPLITGALFRKRQKLGARWHGSVLFALSKTAHIAGSAKTASVGILLAGRRHGVSVVLALLALLLQLPNKLSRGHAPSAMHKTTSQPGRHVASVAPSQGRAEIRVIAARLRPGRQT